MASVKKVLLEQFELVEVPNEVREKIFIISFDFVKNLQARLNERKISADVFIGGSLAKGTIVKKRVYDVDVFVRFSEKYRNEDISNILGKILGKRAKRMHGSRDYFQLNINGIIIEIVPVLNIKTPEEAANVTDLSYFHVNYILKKIKRKKKIAEAIMIAKTFCYAQNCYGAEGYIHGFSGYSLELLMCHYESFEKFLKEIVENKDKILIDDSKFFKRKKNILVEMNESKIQSPIILIDPTFKERNALAGLNQGTFDKFKEVAKKFLKNPSSKFFEKVDIGENIKKKYKNKLKTIIIKTNKQAGDIAGTKSRKFIEFFKIKLGNDFIIKDSEFDYDEIKNVANFYFVIETKKDEVKRGPPIKNKVNLARFKKAHKDCFIKKGFAYTKVKHNLSFDDWFKNFKLKEKDIIKQMSINEINTNE